MLKPSEENQTHDEIIVWNPFLPFILINYSWIKILRVFIQNFTLKIK